MTVVVFDNTLFTCCGVLTSVTLCAGALALSYSAGALLGHRVTRVEVAVRSGVRMFESDFRVVRFGVVALHSGSQTQELTFTNPGQVATRWAVTEVPDFVTVDTMGGVVAPGSGSSKISLTLRPTHVSVLSGQLTVCRCLCVLRVVAQVLKLRLLCLVGCPHRSTRTSASDSLL